VLLLLCFAAVSAYAATFADEGKIVRLRWKNGVIPVAISASLTKSNPYIKPDSDVSGAIRRSFEAWEKAANVRFEITTTDKQTISPAGKNGDGVSLITIAPTPENLLLFSGVGDEVSEEIAARTRTFYNNKGFITEADIVLNPYRQFSTDGSIGTFDLQATLTHEIGHLLGLEHSIVSGATMFERQGKNGTYGLHGFSARTLAADDIAGIRALYGANGSVGGSGAADCCGSIIGKLTAANSRTASAVAKDVHVWIEEADSGRIVAGVLTNADGVFRIEGIASGRYIIYARQLSGDSAIGKSVIAGQFLGEIEVIKNRTANFSRKLKLAVKTFDVRYVGFNGQISELAVPLNGGKSFVVYVGGKNLDADNYKIRFDSAFLSVVPNTIVKHDYGAEVSVISFEVKLEQQIPAGEYGFYLQSKSGEIAFSAGGLTVEAFVNPWSSAVFSASE